MGFEEILRLCLDGSRKILIISDKYNYKLSQRLSKIINKRISVSIINNLSSYNQMAIVSNNLVVCCFNSKNYNILKKIEKFCLNHNKKILILLDWKLKHLNKRYWRISNNKISEFGKRLKKVLQITKSIEIKGKYHFHINVKNKKWFIMDGICRKNRISQLPDGEVYTIISEDDIIGNYKLPPKSILVEFGIGINPNLNGKEKIISFDEKLFGTVHLGINISNIHYDFIFNKITIWFDGKKVKFNRKNYSFYLVKCMDN